MIKWFGITSNKMAPKGNKTLKPDNTILIDYKKSHNDDKQELAQIDGDISDAEAELTVIISDYESESLAKRLEIIGLKEKKLTLSDRVAKNKQILGEDE